MTVPYSLDEIVRTSEEGVVRNDFDARTLVALRIAALVFLISSFFMTLASLGEPIRAALQGCAFAFSLLIVLAMRQKGPERLRRLMAGRARPIAIVFVLTQTALLFWFLAPSEGIVAFSALIPMGLIAFRLLPAEHVLLHAGMSVISFVTLTIAPIPSESFAGMFVPGLMVTVMTMMLALFLSRRRRQSIVSQWIERRASAREQIRMRDELRYARELQLSMLPECAPPLGWAELCAVSIPATEVGGDYFDYFVEPDRVAVVCGDVAGHGMASGLVLSAVRSGFTLLRDELHDPARVLTRLHDLVARTSRRRMLVTVSVALFDRLARTVTIASAGHPPILIRRANATVETIELFAPPLGVRLPLSIPQRVIPVQPGDAVVLHSDGVYEAQNAAGELYGLDRLARLLEQEEDTRPEALRDAILADVASFRGTAEQTDDITIVVCRVA